jgi:hypothetical protein
MRSNTYILANRTATATTNPMCGVETKEVKSYSLATTLYRIKHCIGVSDLDMY